MWGIPLIAASCIPWLWTKFTTPSDHCDDDTNTTTKKVNLVIDTDFFSDVDDAAALLLAATSPHTNLLAVNINVASTYSVLAASAILAYYGKPFSEVPLGVRRPLEDKIFIDTWGFELGEYASKVAFRYADSDSGREGEGRGSLTWGRAEDAWDPVMLYRRILAGAEDGSVTIASIGFLENLSGLLNTTADGISLLAGPDLIAAKVSELVVMGGAYPSGHEFNFWGDNPLVTAHVINSWKGKIVFSGFEMGENVLTGVDFMNQGPEDDPVRRAYFWYTYGESRASWDPLTILYAINGLGDMFEYRNKFGYNVVHPNGSNQWIHDEDVTNQHFLGLRVSNSTAASRIDRLLLDGAQSAILRP
ncbi:inosine/uridine-preferring nucleoside hydrolase [Xylariaceae sp. FL0255]|nr:inosine/uridine-preferring nucleoside hydrolase [Xylariaceae sp. FL0255]